MTHTLIEWHKSLASALARVRELTPLDYVIDAYVDFLGQEYGSRGHGWCVVGTIAE